MCVRVEHNLEIRINSIDEIQMQLQPELRPEWLISREIKETWRRYMA
jgi:hypothetical protein